MLFSNSLAFSMIQQTLAIWFLVPLSFLSPAWESGSSQFMYCWSHSWLREWVAGGWVLRYLKKKKKMMSGSLWQSHIWKWELVIGNRRKGSFCYNMPMQTNKKATSTEMYSSILWKIKFVSNGIEYYLRKLVSKILKEEIGSWWLLTVKCRER